MHIKEIAQLPENLKNEYQDLSSSHNYRTEIPNIIFHMNLTPWEFKAYCVIKKTASDRGSCFKSNSTLSDEIGCSVKFTIDLKKDLERLNLIKITKRKNDKGGDIPDLIQIKDIWPQNMEYMSKLYPKNQDNDLFKIIDMGMNHGKGGGLPPIRGGVNHGKGEGVHRSHKEEPIQEDPKEEYKAYLLTTREQKEGRKEALKKEIEFRSGRFDGISIEQLDSWKRAYPEINIEASIAQFEIYLSLNPKSIKSTAPWGVRINSWVLKQSQGRDKLKEEVVQSIQPVKEEIKSEKEVYEPFSFCRCAANSFIKEWSDKLGDKGLITFISNVFTLRLKSVEKPWIIPVSDEKFFRFLDFAANVIKQEIQMPQT